MTVLAKWWQRLLDWREARRQRYVEKQAAKHQVGEAYTDLWKDPRSGGGGP